MNSKKQLRNAKNQCICHIAPAGRKWAPFSGALFCFVMYLAEGHSPSRALLLHLHYIKGWESGSAWRVAPGQIINSPETGGIISLISGRKGIGFAM